LILEIVEGSVSGRQLSLDAPVEMGRDPGLPLALDDEHVSRRHARVSSFGETAMVEDLGSTNGTYVNDQPIVGRRELTPGDRVRVGTTVVEVRSSVEIAREPTVARAVPQITPVDAVLARVPEHQLSSAGPVTAGVPSFLAEETEPGYVPPQVAHDEQARSDYQALAALVDPRVERQAAIAVFVLLAVGALALIVFFALQ